MSRLGSFLLFFAIVVSLLGLVHAYVWARLVRDSALPPLAHKLLTAAFVALFVSVPVTLVTVRSLPRELGRPLSYAAYIWLGLCFLLLFLVVAGDVVRLGAWLSERLFGAGLPADPERRITLKRLLAGGIAVAGAALGVASLRSGLGRFVLRELEVGLPRLPAGLDGTRIVQLTDMHVGPTIGREFVEQVVAASNALEPDVIAITGDLVDGSVDRLRDHVAPLAKLNARWGVYFVTGNHEFYSGAEEWCAELERLGVRVLRNERVAIGDGEHSFDLAGIEDPTARQFGGSADLPRALLGRDPSRELVLLAHQPRAIFEAERHGVGLQLSGHTHGGQIFPWNFLVRLQQPVVSGLARIGRAFIYVSSGTGYWGPPMRLGFPAEITKIVLRARPETLA